MALFDQHLDGIVAAMEEANFVELASDRLIVHGCSGTQKHAPCPHEQLTMQKLAHHLGSLGSPGR